MEGRKILDSNFGQSAFALCHVRYYEYYVVTATLEEAQIPILR